MTLSHEAEGLRRVVVGGSEGLKGEGVTGGDARTGLRFCTFVIASVC
jgi:hypothetical protein